MPCDRSPRPQLKRSGPRRRSKRQAGRVTMACLPQQLEVSRQGLLPQHPVRRLPQVAEPRQQVARRESPPHLPAADAQEQARVSRQAWHLEHLPAVRCATTLVSGRVDRLPLRPSASCLPNQRMKRRKRTRKKRKRKRKKTRATTRKDDSA